MEIGSCNNSNLTNEVDIPIGQFISFVFFFIVLLKFLLNNEPTLL